MINIFKKRKEEKQKRKVIEILKYVIPVVLAIVVFLIVKFVIIDGIYGIKKIDLDEYNTLVNDSTKSSLIYLTTTNCDTCNDTETMIKKVMRGSGIKTYELNIGELSSEDMAKFMDTFTETSESVITPAFVLVKDGKLVSSLIWPFEEEGFIEYLQNNELVK